MAFCSNCGHQIADGAKFCFECGTPVAASTAPNEQRKTVYDGTVHKCPRCNEVLDSFVTVCPSCGYELRGATATSAVKEFAAKLDSATSDKQKANIIRNFPIPNTKEDIFEFMILVSSNIDEHPNRDIFNAWIAKFEQCYSKSKLAFKTDSDFCKIQSIYEETTKEIRRIKRKGPTRKLLKIFLPIVLPILFLVVAISISNANTPKLDAEENARLEAIVIEVENALANGEYDLAMMQAKSIDFSRYDDELERQWDIERDYLIKKVIAAAAEEGIVMEYPTDTADEKDQPATDYHSKYEDAQQNIDDFNEQMADVKDQWESMWNEDPTEETSAPVSTSLSEYNVNGANSAVVSQDTIQQFTNGYEKAEFSKYDSSEEGTQFAESRIYFYCTLDQTEILEADGTTTILGHVTDDSDNEWLIQLHFVPAVSKTAFDGFVGKSLILRGVYSGYSGARNIPVVVLDEMIVLDTGENILGMQKLLDS